MVHTRAARLTVDAREHIPEAQLNGELHQVCPVCSKRIPHWSTLLLLFKCFCGARYQIQCLGLLSIVVIKL